MNLTVPTFANNFQAKITNFLSKDNVFIRLMAYCSGFMKRCRVLMPDKLITMLTIASFRSKASTLEDMVSIYKSLDPGVKITKQALQERINSDGCVTFIKMALEHVLNDKILYNLHGKSELLKPFKRVLLEDSSSFELSNELAEEFKGFGGNSSKSSLKMNLLYDLKSASCIHLKEYSGVVSDQTIGSKTLELLKKGDLLLRDLGYLKVKDLIGIQKEKAFYLSRLSGGMSIYESKNGTSVAFTKLFTKYQKKGVLDIDVFIGPEKFPTRLIGYRVPEQVANKRRYQLNKTAKSKGRTVLAENSARQDFTIYITNVPRKIWETHVIQTVYRLRWQIELIFRSWKSQLRINVILGTTRNRIRGILYAKWLAIIICSIIHELIIWFAERKFEREGSFHKTINYFLLQNHFEELIRRPKKTIKALLDELGVAWFKDKSKKKISTLQMVKYKMTSYV